MSKITIPAKLIRLAQSCEAKQDVRYYLNGIFIGKNGDIVGTDGHRLAKTRNSWNVDDTKILDADIIVAIDGKVLKTAIDCIFDFDTMTVTCTGKAVKIFPFTLIDGKFPDYSRVIPDKTTMQPVTQYGLNLEYLVAAKVLTENSKYGGVTISFFGDDSSCLFEVPDSNSDNPYWPDDTCMIIMPMRLK